MHIICHNFSSFYQPIILYSRKTNLFAIDQALNSTYILEFIRIKTSFKSMKFIIFLEKTPARGEELTVLINKHKCKHQKSPNP